MTTRFEMDANYLDVQKPRTPHEPTVIRFRSGHGVYAYISLSPEKVVELKEKLNEEEKE